MALEHFSRALRAFSLAGESSTAMARREPPPLLRLRTEEEEAAELRYLVNQLREDRPMTGLRLLNANKLVQQVLDSLDIESGWRSLQDVRTFVAGLLPGTATAAQQHSSFRCTQTSSALRIESIDPFVPEDDLAEALYRDRSEQEFVACVMQLCHQNRAASRDFSPEDELALEQAYRLLDRGVRLPRNFLPILHSPDRTYPTYLSFADPGEGHLAVTVRDASLLEGLIVHVEYIDRDNVENKELVEAYRLPAVRNAARVRLHVGSAAPVTAFIGRPVFEGNNYDLGLLKAGHTMASVCSAMFSHGVADCKIAMDYMSARQAVDFMHVVAGNVVRNPVTQRLSAAFNINNPIVNDLGSRGAAPTVSDRFAIAELAVRLTAKGRFNKVAWDGASNGPSEPIVGTQLTRTQLLTVVHAAHERGLETYISAGMDGGHMRDAVCIGVGGVGIGTKLHFRDEVTKAIGEIDPKKVRDALDIRKKAAASAEGLAAAQLARLDWRYFERTLPPNANAIRSQLFEAISFVLDMMDRPSAFKNIPESTLDNLKRRTADAEAALADSQERVISSDAERSRKTGVPSKVDRVESTKPSRATIRSTELVEAWGRRALAASASAGGITGNGLLSPAVLNSIKTFLDLGDRDGLRRLYLTFTGHGTSESD
jgi:hypothetical protein